MSNWGHAYSRHDSVNPEIDEILDVLAEAFEGREPKNTTQNGIKHRRELNEYNAKRCTLTELDCCIEQAEPGVGLETVTRLFNWWRDEVI